MELALYDPESGYYARAAQRSGRAGDFFTSVDVGPLFGELLEMQLFEMATVLWNAETVEATENGSSSEDDSSSGREGRGARRFDLVEVGAGNGRLSADILKTARQSHPSFYDSIRLHLVEVSHTARAGQHDALAEVSERLASSRAELPETFEGVLIANELLDALPTHQVVMRDDGLREIYVSRQPIHRQSISRQSQVGSRQSADVSLQSHVAGHTSVGRLMTDDCRLTTVEGPPSTPALQAYLDRLGVALEPGWRVEINLRAVDWVRDAARRLQRGFMMLIDYGHEATELYSASHSTGTLTSFAGHRSGGAESDPGAPPWLQHPGAQDITAHVDFSSIRAAAEAEVMTTVAFLDQTYFLMGLLPRLRDPHSALRTPQFKSLIMPGGLGSTMKVLILGKGVGTPSLAGCSFKVRVT